jgi:kinesin family member 22
VPVAQLVHNRIVEIEWSVKNDTAFKPSPRKPRKTRSRRKTNAIFRGSDAEDEGADVEEVALQLGESRAKLGSIGEAKEFGLEITNVESPAKSKRPHSPVKQDAGGGKFDATAETPPKKQKTGSGKLMIADGSDGEDSEYIPLRRSPRKTARAVLA